ncbi:MAG: porphobilinogen synthase, partial [Komagataeibacter saccharivorans]
MSIGQFPHVRPRRNGHDRFTRRLVSENTLSTDNLIWPIFVTEGTASVTDVASMPGVQRVSLDRLAAHVEPAAKLDIPAIALFPITPTDLRDENGTEATNPDNLMCRA